MSRMKAAQILKNASQLAATTAVVRRPLWPVAATIPAGSATVVAIRSTTTADGQSLRAQGPQKVLKGCSVREKTPFFCKKESVCHSRTFYKSKLNFTSAHVNREQIYVFEKQKRETILERFSTAKLRQVYQTELFDHPLRFWGSFRSHLSPLGLEHNQI